jgi:hypothetical protein
MNYQKLQSDVLKDFIKYPYYEDRGIRQTQGLAKYNGYICILTKYAIYMIPEEKFFLDYEKIVNASKDFTNDILKMLVFKDVKDAVKTGEVVELDNTRKCNVFKLVGGENVYINKKYLSYFEDKKEYYYVGTNFRGPICIYDNTTDDLIGFVLPIHPNFIKK